MGHKNLHSPRLSFDMRIYKKVSAMLEGTIIKKTIRKLIRTSKKYVGKFYLKKPQLDFSNAKNDFLDLFFSEETGQYNRLEILLDTKKPRQVIKNFVSQAKNSSLGQFALKNVKSSSLIAKNEKTPSPNLSRIVTLTRSWGFVDPLLNRLEKDHGVDISRIDLAECDNRRFDKSSNRLKYYREQGIKLVTSKMKRAEILRSKSSYFDHQELSLIDQADIVFIEWMNINALTALPFISPDKKIIVRIHSHEIYSFYPILIDFGKIDGLIFISDGARAMFEALWGWLLPSKIKIFVGENIRDDSRIKPDNQQNYFKGVSRNKIVGMLQYNIPVKDFNFALELFDRLHIADPDYKMLLAGLPLSSNLNDENKKLLERINSYGEGTICELGYLNDVSSFFNSVGFILSTSKREGSHEAVIEGAAHGCVPIIRDWPVLSYVSGAKKAFPRFDVFKSSDKMVTSILEKSDTFEQFSIDAKRASLSYYGDYLIVDYLNFFVKVATNEE